MRRKIFIFLILTLTYKTHATDSINQRIKAANTKVEELFYLPRNELEKHFLNAGAYFHWLSYSSSDRGPQPNEYKGYVLFADPYHRGLKRITFLMGSDCSRFVHRYFQLLGAEYPYMKTRHFVALARKENPPDVPSCRWNYFKKNMRSIRFEDLGVGDIFVQPNEIGFYGERGHMGIIINSKPWEILHSKDPQRGIVRESIDFNKEDFLYFRFQGRLRPMPTINTKDLLQKTYEDLNNLGCE